MADEAQRLYDEVCRHARQTAVMQSVEAVLEWDARTYIPSAGAEHRGEQLALLAGLIHQRQTDPDYGRRLAELAGSPLAADPHGDTGTNIRQLKRLYDKKVKLPRSLVEELSRTTAAAQQLWEDLRGKNDFPAFRPMLEKIVALKQQEADALGYPQCRYDALLDDYEPQQRTAAVAEVLAGLREALVPLVGEITSSGRQPDTTILRRPYPVEAQEAFAREAAARIGFDFDRGRLDVTSHPFCCPTGPNDCRITTRYEERYFGGAFFSILHESGHGIYEQGLPAEHYGLPLGTEVSLGIHESQSRLWENFVGRSRAFWEHFFPEAKRHFRDALRDVTLDEFHFAVNEVRPSLIRVEADEATYNLHILVRFELEQALLEGELAVGDLPAAWNQKYRHYLGIEPPDDDRGVLQDIHWSGGSIGYFPTYALGNLYAAQLFATADDELGGLSRQFAEGEFRPLRHWLHEKVHSQGQRWPADDLVERVTGRRLSHVPLIEHLRSKLGPLYGLA